MASADVVGRCLAASPSSNGQHLEAPSLSELHKSQDSPSFDFEFDVEAFEKHILEKSTHFKDDDSYPSCSSHCSYISEHCDSSACKEIEEMISNASVLLDEKLEEIMNFDFHPNIPSKRIYRKMTCPLSHRKRVYLLNFNLRIIMTQLHATMMQLYLSMNLMLHAHSNWTCQLHQITPFMKKALLHLTARISNLIL